MYEKLIIVESPSKCKKIEEYAGPLFKCLATCGHIYSLDHIKDVDVENGYAPKYKLMKTKKRHLDAIKTAIQQIKKTDIYLATDPDREGEAIAWHLCQHFNLDVNTTKRITFNEITKKAVCASLEHPKTIDMQMVKSQQARQTVDLIVGFKTCPILWKHLGIGVRTSPLSSGRCQTPCLKLVKDLYDHERTKEINIKYKINAFFENTKTLLFTFDLSRSLGDEKIIDASTAMSFLSFIREDPEFSMGRDGAPKKSILKAPIPLSTSLLQQKANQYLGMSPTVTMRAAQKLYEKGLITYMRTDSHRYSADFINQVVSFMKNDPKNQYLISNPHSLVSGRGSQDGHESIRPTNIKMSINAVELSGSEKRLYHYIFYHSLQTFMKDAIVEYYDLKCAYTRVLPNELKPLVLKTTLRKTKYLGWKAVETKFNHDASDGGDSNNGGDDNHKLYDKYLNMASIVVPLKSIQLCPYLSGGPTYYSEANLVRELEAKQIGRPSTFASLVDKIQSRNYVFRMDIPAKELDAMTYGFQNIGDKKIDAVKCSLATPFFKNRLVIQELGKNVNEFCYSFFEPLFNYDFTASLEQKLDAIANGGATYEEVCHLCDTIVDECIAALNANDKDAQSGSGSGTTIKQAYKNKKKSEIELGIYDNILISVKSGIYGYYAQHGTDRYSLRGMNMIDIEDFDYDAVVSFIERQKGQKETNMLREIDDKISIWKGKKGKNDYIMIKATPSSAKSKYKPKPTFINLKTFNDDYLECDVERIKEFIKEKTEKKKQHKK